EVLVSGTLYTARDAAHLRMKKALTSGEPLPMDIKDACIYYAGPTPAPPGEIIGACGPTTSSRMDDFAPDLYDRGLGCVIGKGPVDKRVRQAIQRNGAVYFAATGGAGALIAKSVISVEEIAYQDLGPESIKKLVVKDMPVIVAVIRDENIYKE
ncbi:MAG: FumA C-terminus/TtdB family hydratase beta subunit, partial [Eubacteriales bacterium]